MTDLYPWNDLLKIKISEVEQLHMIQVQVPLLEETSYQQIHP